MSVPNVGPTNYRSGGTRGGRDQFSWENVKGEKYRENYLGNSLKAPVGRWCKGKDLTWYAKGKKKGDETDKEKALREEKLALMAKERQLMDRALALGSVSAAATDLLENIDGQTTVRDRARDRRYDSESEDSRKKSKKSKKRSRSSDGRKKSKNKKSSRRSDSSEDGRRKRRRGSYDSDEDRKSRRKYDSDDSARRSSRKHRKKSKRSRA